MGITSASFSIFGKQPEAIQALYMFASMGEMASTASLMYFTGIPVFPTLLEDFILFI